MGPTSTARPAVVETRAQLGHWEADTLLGAGRPCLLSLVERQTAIGAYEDRLREAKWELANPLAWVASLLYAPLWVFERAGLMDPFEAPGPLLNL